MSRSDERPLVVHLVYRLDFGGLETLLVECINRMPSNRYQHAIVCLTGHTHFADKIARPDVAIYDLQKPPGLALGVHLSLWRLLRRLRPAILHTYNLSAIEYAFTATLAGVPVRIHAEHGRDAADPHGLNRKHNLLRRLLVPFVDCYVPVSRDLQRWLKEVVRIPDGKNAMIDNGVDTERFSPAVKDMSAPPAEIVIGTVGRIQDVKNHAALIDAFVELRKKLPDYRTRLRLVIVGDGPLLPQIRQKVADLGIEDVVTLPGARTDIEDWMRRFTIFALPSIAEGTPITILEAMASGLPVVATHVGGIPEIVNDDVTGTLVNPGDTKALANALAAYCLDPALIVDHGQAGRNQVEKHGSVSATVSAYTALYDSLCQKKSVFREPVRACAE